MGVGLSVVGEFTRKEPMKIPEQCFLRKGFNNNEKSMSGKGDHVCDVLINYLPISVPGCLTLLIWAKQYSANTNHHRELEMQPAKSLISLLLSDSIGCTSCAGRKRHTVSQSLIEYYPIMNVSSIVFGSVNQTMILLLALLPTRYR